MPQRRSVWQIVVIALGRVARVILDELPVVPLGIVEVHAHPHRTRVYFNDLEGNDWEFVEYHSSDPAERNDYDLPD